MPFLDSLDIANRAVQLLGGEQILSTTEDSPRQVELSFAYDKLRRPEMRRNIWRCCIRNAILRAIDVGTMLLVPAAYSSAVTYLPGSIVMDDNRQIWLSMHEDNVNNDPGGNNEVWDSYHGPMTVSPFDPTISYWAGELVYVQGSGVGTGPLYKGGYQIYMSLANANADVPGTVTAWSVTATYYGGQVVSYSGAQYVSLIELNTGNTPAAAVLPWAPGTTYSSGQQVTGTNNFIYTSAVNGNIANDPVTDNGTYWTPTNTPNAWAVTTSAPSSIKWIGVNCTMQNLIFSYPIGAGPSSETVTKNVFRLPAGFLRHAPQDPKAGSYSTLGAPANPVIDDWEFAGDYLITSDSGAINFRFAADITRVSAMDDLFCEGLACRLAMEVCEKLTQSASKLTEVKDAYNKAMSEARLINAIELGAVEQPLDDFIACRA